MPNASETGLDTPIQANNLTAIQERVAAGRISWTGPLLLMTARSVLLVASQGLVALILMALNRPSPWKAAGDWWNVYGTLVDIGCLLGMRYFLRREGLRLRDLLGPIKMRGGRDLWLGLGFFALVFPFFLGGSLMARHLVYGHSTQDPTAYLIHGHGLPLWAIVYSLTVWWVIWSPTEEATYQAYVMPRLQALTGGFWLPFLFTGFWWTAQHCALPLILDWRFILFRFLMFLPGVLMLQALYVGTRRLAPLVVAHWPMDIAAAIMTAIY